MDLDEYIKYVINYKLLTKRTWHTSLFGIKEDNSENEYVKIVDKKCYLKVKNPDNNDSIEEIEWPSFVYGKGILNITNIVNLDASTLECLDKNTKTTLGRFIVNYILIEFPYGGRLPYIHGDITHTMFIEATKEALSSEVITVDDYKIFVNSCTYLEELNKLYTPSSTEKLVSPPPGLKKFKLELSKEYVKKHGVDWDKDPSMVVEYDNALKKYYSDYIKDDPSDGVMANAKTKGNALSKKYLTFSSTNAFGAQEHIDESLLEGYPEDPEKLSALFNTTRAASYSRGAETQKGGAVAKSVLRATSSMRIEGDDCGTPYGKRVDLNNDNVNNYLGRYIISKNTLTEITKKNINSLVGKTVTIRSPMYCIAKAPTICKTCMGKLASGKPNGISLIVTNISSIMTTAALKAMHKSTISTVKIDMSSMVS